MRGVLNQANLIFNKFIIKKCKKPLDERERLFKKEYLKYVKTLLTKN